MEHIGAIPLTAYATAYHRMLESQDAQPLVVDLYAKLLVEPITTDDHRFSFQRRDYTIVRTYVIDTLICSWLDTHPAGQLVLLGAGLDCRVYRLDCIPSSATVFELDMAETIAYKADILHDQTPSCELHRIAADLNKTTGIEQLIAAGLDPERPILWIMEGLLYYLNQSQVRELLAQLHNFKESSLVADICVPILAEVKFGLFMRYFQWGLALDEVQPLFHSVGWSVEAIYADEVDQGRDVGQQGMIFIFTDDLSTGIIKSDNQQANESHHQS